MFKAAGNPYGTSTTTSAEGVSDNILAAIRAQYQRLVTFAGKIAECGKSGGLKIK